MWIGAEMNRLAARQLKRTAKRGQISRTLLRPKPVSCTLDQNPCTLLGLFLPRRPVFWQVCEQIGQAFTRFHNISRKRQPVCLVIGWTGFLSRFAKRLLAKLVKQIDTLLWLLGGTAQIYWHDMNSTTVV
jgi:hypothetical protein